MAERRVVPFEAAHYIAAAGDRFPWADVPQLAAMHATGPAYTLLVDDQVAGCAGVLLLPWGGVGQAWAILTAVGKAGHALAFDRAVLRGLRQIIRVHRLIRVQAHTIRGDVVGARWAEHLGLRREAELVNFGPGGATFVLWAWTQPAPAVVPPLGSLFRSERSPA